MQRHVNHRMGHIQKKGTLFVSRNKTDRAFRVPGRQHVLSSVVHVGVDHFLLIDQRQVDIRNALAVLVRRHVVGIRQPEILVETVARGQEFLRVAQMPLSEHRRRVTFLFAQSGQRHFVCGESDFRVRHQRAMNADTIGVATRQQRGATGRTNSLRGIKAGELHPLGSHAIEVGRGVALRPKRTDVRIAHVVNINDDNVGCPLGRRSQRGECQCKYAIQEVSRHF